MRRDARTYLWDAKDACQAILGFVAGLDASGYANNPLVHSAVERKFEIIGEALNQLSRTDAALGARISDLAQIVAFRNQLIHGYAVIDHATVWHTIQSGLPRLLATVSELLEELGADLAGKEAKRG